MRNMGFATGFTAAAVSALQSMCAAGQPTLMDLNVNAPVGQPLTAPSVMQVGQVGSTAKLAFQFGALRSSSVIDNEGTAGVWMTDGTQVGTVVPFTPRSQLGAPVQDGCWFGGRYYFRTFSTIDLGQLFSTDGTSCGTVTMPGTVVNFGVRPTAVNGRVLTVAGIRDLGVASGSKIWAIESNTPVLVADLAPGGGLSVTASVVAGNRLFMAASRTNGEGNELFVTDGTLSGSGLVLDIAPGTTSSSPQDLVAAGSKVYFTAQTSAQGRELWVSDGTPGGTVGLGDLNPGGGASFITMIAPIGESMLFAVSAVGDGAGEELWISNGTLQGTMRVKDISPGLSSSSPRFAGRLGDVVFLAARPDGISRRMWRTDGTEAGTYELVAADPFWGTNSTTQAINCVTIGNEAYFTVNGGATGPLYRTDGTSVGTEGLGESSRNIVAAGGVLYFNGPGPNSTTRLWAFDTATQLRAPVADGLSMHAPNGSSIYATDLNGDLIYVSGQVGALWKANARTASAGKLKDLVAANQSAKPILGAWSGDVVVGQRPGVWRSEGTPGTTGPVQLPQGNYSGSAVTFGEGNPMFVLTTGTGNQVFRFDPPYVTPTLVATRGTGGPSISFWRGVGANNVVTLSSTSTRQWQIAQDGSVLELDAVNQPAMSGGFVEWNGAWYFLGTAGAGANSGKSGLWRTLGTPESTELITLLQVGESPVTSARGLVAASQGLVFVALTAATGQELWISDGTSHGTQMTAEQVVGPEYGVGSVLQVSNNLVYAQSPNGSPAAPRLYETNGTLAGTRFLTEFDAPYSHGSGIGVVSTIGANVVAPVLDSRYGTELWFVAPDGSKRVMDLIPGPQSGVIRILAAKDDVVYFTSAANCEAGEEIWRTDGTMRGTYMVTEAMVGERSSGVETLRVGATKLFFDGYSDASGVELWSHPIPCRADINGDGVVDFFDYLDFVASFAAGEADADFNQDNVVDLFDYLDFVNRFAGGCQ